MARPSKQILDCLGPSGLSRALDDLLDQTRLVRLANTCGIKYRGMRTKSQRRSRLVEDLAEKACKQDDVGKAVLRALERETTGAAREWQALDVESKILRLCDEEFLRANGNVGRYLFLLADAAHSSDLGGPGARLARERLLRIASNGGQDGTPAEGAAKTQETATREIAKARRQVQERDRKLRHLEAQLAKARDAQKTAKQDLIQRKGELAESRMLVERLRDELAQAEGVARAARDEPAPAVPEKALTDLTRAVKRLASEQRKLVHLLEPVPDRKSARAEAEASREALQAVKELERRIVADADRRDEQLAALGKRVAGLRTAVRNLPAASAPPAARRTRPRGQAQRVGVFIDVQNMYYGARRLKGKLDFDALLEAAVQGRRLIKTTAYVVVSKETDQSQFIAMLEKRAIEVRRKVLQVRTDGSMKGDWDMELAFDILDAAPGLDVVVLVSGDGDFTSLVKRVKSMGPRVEVIAFPRTTAKSLVQAADSFQPLDRKFMIYERRSKRAVRRATVKTAEIKPGGGRESAKKAPEEPSEPESVETAKTG